MKATRLVRTGLLMLIAAGAVTMGACASMRTVNEILADPSRYRNKDVKLSGEVIDSYSVVGRGAYKIDDGTGQLWVVSDSGVPRKSARVTVKGEVKEGFNFGSLGGIKLPEGIAAGLVLMESSHKAKR